MKHLLFIILITSLLITDKVSASEKAHVILETSQDTYLDQDNPTTIYGSSDSIHIWKSFYHSSLGLFGFDLSTLTYNFDPSQVISIKLKLYVLDIYVAWDLIQNDSVHGAFWLNERNGNWDENTTTFNNMDWDGKHIKTISLRDAKPNSFIEIDVTDTVRNWLKTPSAPHALEILSIPGNTLET